MDAATVTYGRSGNLGSVTLAGRVVLAGLEALRRQLAEVRGPGEVVIDLAGVEALDTAGAWAILDLKRRLEADGVRTRVDGAAPAQASLLETVEASLPAEPPPAPRRRGFVDWLETLGRDTADGVATFAEMLSLLGAVVVRVAGLVVRPWRLRLTALVTHMEAAGLNAAPIVSLMAFLIGVVLAFQGAIQLRPFGADVFVVDLIAISVLRELGILLTAIIVAGRSASAFTAAIGSMKMREEIDAMRTLSIDPIDVLVVPRVLALIVMLPILGLIADLMGLVGGAVMAWIELGVSPGMFVARLLDAAGPWDYAVGIIKAPFFALIIALVGCYEGLKVEGTAESLGRLTSRSVVLAIFLVIVVDALFSIFFAIVGV